MKNIRLISFGTAIGVLAIWSSILPARGADPSGGGVNAPPPYTATVGASANQGTLDQNGSPAMSGQTPSSLTFRDLPQAVQSAVRGQIGDQQIRAIKTETNEGETEYKIQLERRSGSLFRPMLLVAANGLILKESHMGKTIHEAAGAEAPPDR